MSSAAAALGLVLTVFLPGPDAPGAVHDQAADAVTLRDGKLVLGEMVEPSPRNTIGIVVRRAWARERIPDWLERWEAASGPSTRRALTERCHRLEAWRRDRSAGPAAPDDRITPWIDRELARLGDGKDALKTPLLLVKLARTDVRSATRAPGAHSRLLRQAWVAGLPDPETMRLDELKGALEGRGYDLSVKAPVAIDALLPPQPESEAVWLTRRAATEVSYDPGLAFVRYQGVVFPDPGSGQALNPADALIRLSALKDLLADNPADPLASRLREVEKRGRIGATVTKLDVAPDLSVVTVEIALWVLQGPSRWTMTGSRSARVRPDDLGPEAGKDLAGDPQVSAAFQIVEAVGRGSVTPELKRRSLSVGAATQKALGQARSAAQADLAALALPVLERPREPDPPPRRP
jgi:hypothetical protein